MKMQSFVIPVLVLIISCTPTDKKLESAADLSLLVEYMEGSFSSERQAAADSAYFHITLDMRQIWNQDPTGAWLYVEQTAASSPGQPYRQRIYHLQQHSDTTFTSTIYGIPRPDHFVGGCEDPSMFSAITSDSLNLLEGCSISLILREGVFSGSTKAGACLNSWGEATYATSEVTITPDMLYSWDRGWNDSHKQVWGAEKGGYEFVKTGNWSTQDNN